MLFQLLGNQVVLGDHELFFIRVGAKLDDLHTVQQRPGHGVQRIRRGDKQHVGQIKGDFQIMVTIVVVLFRVQHFQQSSTGIAAVVGTQFVDLVQQQHRIAAARLRHGGHDTAGHRADVGLPVSPDVRLVVNAAKGNSRHFPIQAPGDGIGNGGLAHAGRAYQTQDLGRHLGRHFPDGDGF